MDHKVLLIVFIILIPVILFCQEPAPLPEEDPSPAEEPPALPEEEGAQDAIFNFKQIPDLTLSVWILEKYFIEIT